MFFEKLKKKLNKSVQKNFKNCWDAIDFTELYIWIIKVQLMIMIFNRNEKSTEKQQTILEYLRGISLNRKRPQYMYTKIRDRNHNFSYE